MNEPLLLDRATHATLSYISGDRHWDDAVRDVSRHVSRLETGKLDGLVPLWIDPKTGQFSKNGVTYTMGARTDRSERSLCLMI